MAVADELLELADHLGAPPATISEQACFRRAVSTADYAVFHLLLQAAAERWAGSRNEQIGLERFLSHQQMKTIAETVRAGRWTGWSNPPLPVPPELVDIARTFSRLQEARHAADYDNDKGWTSTEVRIYVTEARQAIENWRMIHDTNVASEFLLSLMIGKKRVQPGTRSSRPRSKPA